MKNKRLLEIFLEFIKIDGISENEKKVADYIINFLTSLGLSPQIDNSFKTTNSNTGNIVCRINGGGEMLLLSHMDTARSTFNVKPILQEDRIVSDGNTVLGVDNRVGGSVILALVEKIIKEKIATPGFTIAFTTCEETTLEGSRNLEFIDMIKEGYVFDSYLSPGSIIASSFGAIGFKIKIIGKASHSGIAPEKGINAIQIAVNALSAIKTGRIDESTTINFGIIKGGSAVNVVPDQVYIEGEVRSKYSDRIEKHLESIQNIFSDKASELKGQIEFSWQWDFMPFILDDNSNVINKISKAIQSVGLRPELKTSAGGSDANSLNAKGIPTVNLGIGAQNPHANDEFILYKDFDDTFNIAYNLVTK